MYRPTVQRAGNFIVVHNSGILRVADGNSAPYVLPLYGRPYGLFLLEFGGLIENFFIGMGIIIHVYVYCIYRCVGWAIMTNVLPVPCAQRRWWW